MTPISNEQFLSLRQHAELIEADHCGEKVLKLSDGSFLKLFRRKRLISSEMYRPYAKRFALNAEILKKLQIPCPTIISTYTIASIERTAVHYWPLPGSTLRQEFHDRAGEKHASLCSTLGVFIAKLHDSGVYFRSLHLGNVVITPDGSLGLIDIADMQVLGSSISNQKRKRNFLHLFRYSKDIEHLWRHREEFINAYCENLSARKSQNFSSYLKDLFTKAKQDRVEERTP
ncbi:toluene tolerance protein [Pseudomonas chengduensis]|uniref:toluene tolerance protein n=1 Tax=Ectopseudomonas oleovorans TaxID=301 RepID=UPI000DB3D97A|nr:toluene tolerance protein [Pseudomonas chengduensis]MDH1210672.1 toluene tolerance protein [Pseudomonas chengduensis]PZQ43976.1 MAG: toluene tolerance protein [Pseudomonas oleovorans]PZR29255.1 MAG: toluene tolerance protein [Pseudomonas oleovorans]